MGKRVNVTGIAVLVFFLLLGVLISIRLTGLGSHFPNPVGGFLQSVLSPLEKPILLLGNGIRDNTKVIWNFREVQLQNEALLKKVDQLTGDNLKLKEQVLAGMRFTELEGQFRNPTLEKYEKVAASVINRNPTTWYRTLTLNRGSKDGVAANDPVVGALGLIGKVVSVSPTTSEVLLILDGEGQVSALVRSSAGNGTFGIVQGTYKRGGSRLTPEGNLQMLFRREDNVNPGDLVLTAGAGGVYPKDVPIGKVVEIQLDPTGLLKTAFIEPLVNFDTLEEAYIVKMAVGK